MKMFLAAIAMTIAVPAAAQTGQAAPTADHSQHAKHGADHARHGQDRAKHDCCEKAADGTMKCCDKAKAADAKMSCCAKMGQQKSGADGHAGHHSGKH